MNETPEQWQAIWDEVSADTRTQLRDRRNREPLSDAVAADVSNVSQRVAPTLAPVVATSVVGLPHAPWLDETFGRWIDELD